eukprot:1188605-Prorocentrum_minimum.AAC.1
MWGPPGSGYLALAERSRNRRSLHTLVVKHVLKRPVLLATCAWGLLTPPSPGGCPAGADRISVSFAQPCD